MFGGEISNNRGLLIGAAIGMGQRLRAEEDDHDATVANFQAVIDQLQEQLLATQMELASERCEIAGLRAFIKEAKRLDPQTPAFALSGQVSKTGREKTVGTVVYEREYDRKADELGLPGLKGGYAA